MRGKFKTVTNLFVYYYVNRFIVYYYKKFVNDKTVKYRSPTKHYKRVLSVI